MAKFWALMLFILVANNGFTQTLRGFSLPDINKKAYMEVRTLTQSFIDDFLGYYINPNNRKMNALLIGPGLPGGMMGSLMADLENNLKSLNKWLLKRELPVLTEDELLLKLFDEVEYAWPKLGYPPLVTPFSQYVKNVSLVNAINLIKGKQRWEMIDENTWGMILGRSGRLLLLTDVAGVKNAEGDVVTALNAAEVEALTASGVISGGMIPKTETALKAVRNGVRACTIVDGRVPNAVLLELFTDHGAGSMIRA